MDGWSEWYFKYWLERKSLDNKRKIARKMILWKGLKANLLKWSNILMVEFMIILLQLILDKFYCIAAINYLKMICYVLFFCLYKNEL